MMRALVVSALLLAASPAWAGTEEIGAALRDKSWAEADTLAAASPDPVARKLVLYYRLLSPGGGHPAEIAAWNIDIAPDGAGLPLGLGSVAQGAAIFAANCAGCHGEKGDAGDGAPIPKLVGGAGTLASAKPVKTVGSYWPYATTLYDYIHRAMPLGNAQSLSPDQVYAVTAYVLSLNGIVGTDAVLDAHSLPEVRMPNRDGFFPTRGETAR